MPVIRSADAVDHHVHGLTFSSFVAPAHGGSELCAWRLTIPPDVRGVAHRPTRDEIVLLVAGELCVTLEGIESDLQAGDACLVPSGSEFRVDSGSPGATAWVTTTPGLEAVMADGARLRPPWAN